MKTEIVLTVAESKRLIAKGVVQIPVVRKAFKEGLIVITSGSTNGYIVEELLDEKFDKTGNMTGKTLPAKISIKQLKVGESTGDIILEKGKRNKELNRQTAAEKISQGDVFIKGANALNYKQGVAGICIGHPAGGTIAGALGHIIGKRGQLVIPVGLEKCVSTDIYEMAVRLNEIDKQYNSVPRLWPVRGLIFTEIEALETLFTVSVYQIAAGGLAGAEGGVRLLVAGTAAELEKVKKFIGRIQGEPSFYEFK